jgi:hypothetical protein
MGLEGTFPQTCCKYVSTVMAWDILHIRFEENAHVINKVCH